MTTADAELPPASALALPIIITIPSSRPEPPVPVGFLVQTLLQVGHRIGTAALIALLGAMYAAFSAHAFYVPLAIAAGCADVGLCAALIVRSRSVRTSVIVLTIVAGLAAAGWLWGESYRFLGIAVLVADALLCFAIHALVRDGARPQDQRESTGLLGFNGCILVITVVFMLASRTGVIGDAIRDGGSSIRVQAQRFFAAPPTVPVQP